MRGVVLAAGRGRRLGAVTADLPKAMLEIAGRPLIGRQVDALRAAGATTVAAVVGWSAQAVERWLRARSDENLTWFENHRWQQTSMVESLGCAATWLVRGDCLVCYGDIVVTHSDARALASTPGDIVVAYDPAWETMWARRFDDPLGDAESFRLAPDGRLAEIGQPLQSLGDAQGQYLGLLRFTPHGWRELAQVIEDERPQHLTDALNGVVSAGRMPVWTAPVHGPWWEFDTPRDLALGDPVVRAIDASEAATRQVGGSR